MKKLDYEKRIESIRIEFTGRFALLDFQGRDKKFDFPFPSYDKSVTFLFLFFYRALRFSMQILLEKHKAIVPKDFECEKRDKRIWTALIGCFALSKFQFRDQRIDFPDLTNSLNVKFRNEILFGRNQCSTSSYGELCVQKTVETILTFVLDILHNHDFDGSIEGFDVSCLFSFTVLRFPM